MRYVLTYKGYLALKGASVFFFFTAYGPVLAMDILRKSCCKRETLDTPNELCVLVFGLSFCALKRISMSFVFLFCMSFGMFCLFCMSYCALMQNCTVLYEFVFFSRTLCRVVALYITRFCTSLFFCARCKMRELVFLCCARCKMRDTKWQHGFI